MRGLASCLAAILLVVGVIAPLHHLSHQYGAASMASTHCSFAAKSDVAGNHTQIEGANCPICDLAAQLQASDVALPTGLPPVTMVLHNPPVPPAYVVSLCSLTVALRSGRAPPLA